MRWLVVLLATDQPMQEVEIESIREKLARAVDTGHSN
jgi:hypothetical protein